MPLLQRTAAVCFEEFTADAADAVQLSEFGWRQAAEWIIGFGGHGEL